MLNTRSKYGLVAAISLSVVSFNSLAAQSCGPGPHWVDDCPAGKDNFKILTRIQVVVGTCDEIPTDPIELQGRYKANRTAGVLGEDGHFLTIEVPSLKYKNQTHQITLRSGDKWDIPAGGIILERENDPTMADYFSYYKFEVDTPCGTLHTEEFCRQTGALDRIPPPISTTIAVNYPCWNITEIPLFDEYGNEVGFFADRS